MTNQPNNISLTWSFPIYIGIPYGSANIDFFYTESERMQVLTEYVLRLLKIVEQAPASAIRFYLGLSKNEIKVLINDLLDKHYIRQTIDGDLTLDELTTDKLFIKNEDNQLIPRLSKLLEGRRFITVVYAANRYLLLNRPIYSESEFVDSALYDLNKIPSLDEIGNAFQNQFDSIAIESEKKASFHSVTKIRMKASGLYSVPVRLEIDTAGNSNIVVENRDRNKTLDAILLPEISKSIHWNTSIEFPIENTNPGFLLWLKLFPRLLQGLDVNKKSFQDIVSLLVGSELSSNEMTISVGEDLSRFVDPEDFLNQTNIGFFLQNILTSKFDEVIWKPATFQNLSDKEEKIHQRDYEFSRNLLKSLSEPTKTKIRFKLLELNGNIREQPENFAIFAQILNQPQNSLILVKGRAVICTYYCSIGKLLGQSERTLYVPVTVCSTNKQLIETIENMLNGACQSSSFEDSSQSHDVPTIEEVHTCIRQLILNYSPNNDFVNVCSIGSDLQRKFQSIKTFWAMNNVSGLPEFAKKCSNLYQIQIKQGKGTCTIIEIRNVDSSSKDLNIANRTSKLESFKDTSGSQYVPTIDEVHKCIRQLILNYSQNNDFVNVCSIGSDLQRKFQSIKTFWAMNNVSGLPEFAYKYDHLYQIQTRQGKGTCKIIEIRNANSFIVNSGIDDLKVNQNNLSKIADSISDIEKKEFDQMVEEMKYLNFQTAAELSLFISRYKLGRRYSHLTDHQDGNKISAKWFDQLCKVLGLNFHENL